MTVIPTATRSTTGPTAEEMLARTRAETGDAAVVASGSTSGMAPGVGKTYRMLEEGHRRVGARHGPRRRVRRDATAGRTPRRSSTASRSCPRRRIEYRGVVVEEMDTDAVLARRPDGRARRRAGPHQRARVRAREALAGRRGHPRRRHPRHQHLQRPAPRVGRRCGRDDHRCAGQRAAPGRRSCEAADEVELVDMSPHALRQRMRHGNVYPPERTQIALDRFFTESNLTALRELSLRFVARSVDEQIDEMVAAGGPAAGALRLVAERILVLVDGSPAARRALRRGGQLASALHGPLIALVVETPTSERMGFDGVARPPREHRLRDGPRRRGGPRRGIRPGYRA